MKRPAYAAYWQFTVYRNGIGARLWRLNKPIGYTLFYASWQELLAALEPAAWTFVFVDVNDSTFFPR